MHAAAPLLALIPERMTRTLASGIYMRPTFIVGTNKVGKSLLGQALNQHPAILTPATNPEAPALTYFGELVHKLEPDPEVTYGGAGVHSPRSYLERSFRVPREEVYESLRRTCFEIAVGPRHGLAKVLRKVADQRRPLASHARWCVELFPPRSSYEGLLNLYPEAKFIYVLRNGIDAVQARIEAVLAKTQRRVPFEYPCRQWADGVELYRYLHDSMAARVVRFEALMARPDEALQELLSFLDVPHDPRPAAFISASLGANSANRPVRSSLSASPGETWSPEQKEVFIRICGDAMKKAGYGIPF